MSKYFNMMNTWKDWRLSEDKIKMGFAGFDSYFKNIERNIEGVN